MCPGATADTWSFKLTRPHASERRSGLTRRPISSDAEAGNRIVHLYRIITNIRAGAEQRSSCKPGQTGIATVWVQSDSAEDALRQAQRIVEARHYESIGELTAFQEESIHTITKAVGHAGAGEGDHLASGYLKMRDNALARGDGLFEIWF